MRPCEVKGRKATFHKWSHKAWVIDAGLTIGSHPGGQMELDVAIIEYEDGVVTECYPYEVKFTDKEEKADAEGWETKRMGTDWINLCPTCAKEV